MEKLRAIIRSNSMGTSPGFYSGRGAIRCDLNGEILEGIFQGILKEFGEDAADNFVKMVDGIKVISATTFLQELYSLFNCGWKYQAKEKDASGIAIDKDKDGNHNIAQGMASIFASMGNDRDESQEIKSYFLNDHGIEQEVRTIWGPNGAY